MFCGASRRHLFYVFIRKRKGPKQNEKGKQSKTQSEKQANKDKQDSSPGRFFNMIFYFMCFFWRDVLRGLAAGTSFMFL
jgi:hypothetical protein